MKKRGFTLVELLVVVAVIGLLASIIIVSLNAARNRAKNAAIKQALTQLRVAAEWSYDQYEHYDKVCEDSSPYDIGEDAAIDDFDRIRDTIEANKGSATTRLCRDNQSIKPSKWCTEVENMPNGGGWCVDYTGYSGSTTSCDGTNFNCPL